MRTLSRRLGGAVAALLALSVAAGCSSSTGGSAVVQSTSSSVPSSTSSSATPSAPISSTASTAHTSTAPGSVQQVSVAEFLTAAEAGHPVASSHVADPTKGSGSGSTPFGCLDVSGLLASDPTLRAASFAIAARDQTYKSGKADDATFLFESVLNTPAAKDAALIARVLGKALAGCTKPKLTLFGAAFTVSKSTVSTARGCDSGTTSLTVSLGRPAGSNGSKPVAAEIDAYTVQQGTRFAYVVNFYPLLAGNPVAAAQLASTICGHLR